MSLPIHVLHLVRPAAGGMRRYLDTLVIQKEIKKAPSVRFLHHVAGAMDPEWDRRLQSASVPALSLDLAPGPSPLRDARTIKSLERVLTSLRPDILHLHGSKAALIGREAMVRLLARGHSVPVVVYTVHGVGAWERKLPYAARLLERRHVQHTQAYIAVSSAIAEHIHQRWGIPSERIHVIANGVDTEQFAQTSHLERLLARKELGLPDDGGHVLAVAARLAPEKGIDTVVHALAQLQSEVHLAVAGDGPERQRLQRLVMQLGLEQRVHWLGMMKHPQRLFAAADMVLVPSRREGFGLAAAEAMSCGRPVIASDVGGLRQLIQSGHTGVLIPPGEPDSWATAIRGLLADELYRRRLGLQARESIARSFSVQRTRKRTEMVYRLCLLSGANKRLEAGPPLRTSRFPFMLNLSKDRT